MSYLTVCLRSSHKKELFSCGKPLLDSYLHKQAKQDVQRRLSVCFILPDIDNSVKGYYTLSSSSIEKKWLPEETAKKLPPAYLDLPVILLGRLAIDTKYQGQKLGELILLDALKRAYKSSKDVGSMAVVVDPLDEQAQKFYEKYEFILLQDGGKMFLPMATIEKLFPEEDID
jgi:hypothetical protein